MEIQYLIWKKMKIIFLASKDKKPKFQYLQWHSHDSMIVVYVIQFLWNMEFVLHRLTLFKEMIGYSFHGATPQE